MMTSLASRNAHWRRIIYHKNGRLSSQVVDDLIQESYFLALRALRSGKGSFEGRNAADITSWFTRILLNQYATLMRSPKKSGNLHVSIETGLPGDTLQVHSCSPEESAILNNQLKFLRHAIKMCSREARLALLRFLDETHTNEEIERVRRTRARNSIRQIFAREGILDNRKRSARP